MDLRRADRKLEAAVHLASTQLDRPAIQATASLS
jgi:hypothetical protein